MCNDVAVMYAGRIVEIGSTDEVFNATAHPYTEGLFGSLPNLKDQGEELEPIRGMMPDPMHLPEGCAFAPRCPYATEACMGTDMVLTEEEPDHFVTCRRVQNGEI